MLSEGLEHVSVAVHGSKIPQLIPSFLMLKFFQCLCFDLPYSFTSYAHHLTYFFKREGAKITGYPSTVEERFILQPPLAGGIITDFSNDNTSLFALIGSIQGKFS